MYSIESYHIPLLIILLFGKTYLHHFSLHGRVGILWSTPIGSPHVVRWEPSPAVGPALLGLAFRSTLRSLILFPTLTVLVILLVIAWRTPATWIASIMVTVCCIFTALHWNSTRTGNVCCLRTLQKVIIYIENDNGIKYANQNLHKANKKRVCGQGCTKMIKY